MNLNRPLKLKNRIQPYAWGSRDALRQLFGIANPDNRPQAEIWMGAHPKSPSMAELKERGDQPLNNLIAEHGDQLLGEGVSRKFGKQLPYLFKVLSAAEPLSIQAHPTKEQAEKGFQRENQAGIPVDAGHRNYRDDNHKPELIYALTPFRAMNGFRPLNDIITLFRQLDSSVLTELLDAFESNLSEAGLKGFYGHLMQLDDLLRKQAVTEALAVAMKSEEPALQELVKLNDKYPLDIGVFSPLLLNLVELEPGEAMFLDAGTLHAYLEGTGLEVMASSDNVLRGGLTPKHVDVAELLGTIRFIPKLSNQIKVDPEVKGNSVNYPVPVDDFAFEIETVDSLTDCRSPETVELLFCQEGNVEIVSDDEEIKLNAADSCLLPAGVHYKLVGKGKIVRVSCKV
ncbi:mannose-6-phosphate isomerase, class I [Endozoicomonas sp. Mp262]|uniref:mannose-6-phosphate isomerase, class I n=1 Tax=Endozoicomonas sp. Mp262 TaxID=2919499 RepID=UPI0021DAAB13